MANIRKRLRLTPGSRAAAKSTSPRRTNELAARAGTVVIREHPFRVEGMPGKRKAGRR